MTKPPLNQITAPSLASCSDSRFYTRWINAREKHARQVAEVGKLSLNSAIFAELLQNETDAGATLPAAMRRLRNLTLATLIQRDLSGLADLAEVVDTMTALGDFSVRAHLAAITAEMIVIHGTPIGSESGE